jgi:hypothetical protein
MGSCVQLYSLAETPHLPPPPSPAFGLIYEGTIGQPRSLLYGKSCRVARRSGAVTGPEFWPTNFLSSFLFWRARVIFTSVVNADNLWNLRDIWIRTLGAVLTAMRALDLAADFSDSFESISVNCFLHFFVGRDV